jgi:hypothetical protein
MYENAQETQTFAVLEGAASTLDTKQVKEIYGKLKQKSS